MNSMEFEVCDCIFSGTSTHTSRPLNWIFLKTKERAYCTHLKPVNWEEDESEEIVAMSHSKMIVYYDPAIFTLQPWNTQSLYSIELECTLGCLRAPLHTPVFVQSLFDSRSIINDEISPVECFVV